MKAGRSFFRLFESTVLFVLLAVNMSAADVTSAMPTVTGATSDLAGETIESVTQEMEKITPYEFVGDVRRLPMYPLVTIPEQKPYRPLLRPPKITKTPGPVAEIPSSPVAVIPSAPMPASIENFAGMSFSDSCLGGQCGAGWPPDPNGDVGRNHYIQAVNDAYAIYDKTGTLLASFTEDQLWSGSGSNPCNGNSQGDTIVLYDHIADRWILTHFAFAFSSGNPVSPFYECIAVSKTSDPVLGGWWLYPVRMDPGGTGNPPVGTLNDYPKFGIWTDCLYMSANEFTMPSDTFAGTSFASFNKTNMYNGAALTWSLGFINNTSGPFTMIPANLSGTSLPPAGTSNYLVSESTSTFAFEVRKFTSGTNCGSGGFLSAPINVSHLSYVVPGSNTDIVPQPGTSNKLDMIGDRLMQKVQYRNVGGTESLWVVHSVQSSSGSPVSPQWAQINVTGGTIATTAVQQQIYSPDSSLYRWMGSLAVDKDGNMALGYSTSSGSAPNYPSIVYAGRLATDPLNSLPQTETQLIAGGGSQTNNCGGRAPCGRWGDYSAMSVDPTDDCTFWYTNQYYSSQANGSSGNWQTRIGSFKFLSCGGGTCTFSILPTSQAFAAAGGTGSVGVTAAAGCNWTAVSNAAWITITGGGSGSGNGTVNFSVDPNTGAARAGTMTIAGQTFTVNQSGTGGTLSISGMITYGRTLLSGVTVTMSGAASATTVTDSTGRYSFSGLGNGVYTVTPSKPGFTFTPASRTVTLNGASAAGQNFIAAASGTCTFSILPTSQAFAAAGGTGSVNVTASAGCNWTALSNAAWITITGGGSGSGNGTVNYSVDANTGAARTGTMTIAGQTFTVNQSGAGGGGAFSISGKVTTSGGGALSGVTMTLSGATGTTVATDSNGNYVFPGLGDGTYTITPSKTGLAFTPSSRTVGISGASVTGQNFTGNRAL